MREKWHKPLTNALICATGFLGLIVLRWTPTTVKGVVSYLAAAGVLVILGMMLSSWKRAKRGENSSDDV